MELPKQFDNITSHVIDDLKVTLRQGSKVSMAAASFSIYAFEALQKELEKVDELRFIFTSPTEEYLVPAMYKYIAVLKEGKPIEAYVEAGWNKVQDLNLPEGDCEIVYQVMDFNGYVITKRYPIHVEK